MQNCIERTLQSGHASFEVYLWVGKFNGFLFLLNWLPHFYWKVILYSLIEKHCLLMYFFSYFSFTLQTGYLDIWEPATLAIKRDGFSIKSSGTIGVMVTEKFSPSIRVCVLTRHVFFLSHTSLEGLVGAMLWYFSIETGKLMDHKWNSFYLNVGHFLLLFITPLGYCYVMSPSSSHMIWRFTAYCRKTWLFKP